MIGRKIIEHREDDISFVTPERKMPDLTIEIDNFTGHRYLQQNAVCDRDSLTSCVSPIYTPDSSHTFGIPNPTSITSTPVIVDPKKLRKRKRSSLAEASLAATLQSCSSEESPKDIQIRILEQATALISAHAMDAQDEYEAKLTSSLESVADGSLGECCRPKQHQVVMKFESQLLRQHLLSLTRSFGHPKSIEINHDNPLDKQDRHLANLARFYLDSLTRDPVPMKNTRFSSANRFSRRRTMNDVSLACLRKLSTTRHPGGHARSKSLDDICDTWSTVALSLALSDAEETITEKLVQSSFACGTPSNPLYHPSASRSAFVIAQGSTPSCPQRSLDGMHDQNCDNLNGIATIYQNAEPHRKTDILVDLGAQGIECSDYARELIDELDHVHDHLQLELIMPPKGGQIFLPLSPVGDSSHMTIEEHQRLTNGHPPKPMFRWSSFASVTSPKFKPIKGDFLNFSFLHSIFKKATFSRRFKPTDVVQDQLPLNGIHRNDSTNASGIAVGEDLGPAQSQRAKWRDSRWLRRRVPRMASPQSTLHALFHLYPRHQ